MEQFNILVCDDDKSIVDAIEIYLKQEGYHVIKAYNGLEALKALENTPAEFPCEEPAPDNIEENVCELPQGENNVLTEKPE